MMPMHFVETINVIDVSVVGNVATFITDFAFTPNTDYDVVIGSLVFEDIPGNPFVGIVEDAWEFETEDIPNISVHLILPPDVLAIN
jgi:hypothetical protein